MVVCHCLTINDRVIAGYSADPAVTIDDITSACGAGGRCGGCRDTIARLLQRARAGAPICVDNAVQVTDPSLGSAA